MTGKQMAVAAPHSVAIVAMGKSHADYTMECAMAGGRRRVADETWVINAMGGVIDHDLVFMMDDIEEILAKAESDTVRGFFSWLPAHSKPVLTSRAYPQYPATRDYPLEDVLNCVGLYLNGTVAYALAYAMWRGVQIIKLYGCDFTYPDLPAAEAGRGCVEHLLGIARERGIQIGIARSSTLLDTHLPPESRFYGYHGGIRVTIQDGRFVVSKES